MAAIPRPSRRPIVASGLLLAAAPALWSGAAGAPASVAGAWTFLALAAGAAVASGLSLRFADDRATRLAPAFFLAATVTLPGPASVLVAAIALAVSPGSLVGPPGESRRLTTTLSAPIAVLVVVVLARALGSGVTARSDVWVLVHIAACYFVLQGIAWGVRLVGGQRDTAVHRALARSVTRESVNIPVAWLLATIAATAPLHVAALVATSALVLLAAGTLASIERAESRLRGANDALAERLTELATLHAIGREIVSSLDLRRVVAIVDRECRKILDVDELAVALTARDASELVWTYCRRRSESPRESDAVVPDGLETRVARLRVASRVDDLTCAPDEDAPRTLRARAGSVMAAPLVVENRVIGVLAVSSGRTGAFDDHRLAFFSTIGQQAAVAIEKAKHYRMATRDSLTGLFLRDYFFRRVDEERTRAERYRAPFALMMMDLDGFKTINDEHGHPIGDRYLRAFARVLRGHLRAADLACRYGGDEFCVLLPETDRDGAVTIAERIRRAAAGLSDGVDDAPAVRVSVSIGIAAYPEEAVREVSALLRSADQALYRAKRTGRNRVVAATPRRPRLVRRPSAGARADRAAPGT